MIQTKIDKKNGFLNLKIEKNFDNFHHIQLSLFGNMDKHSRPPRELPEILWAPTIVYSPAPSMPNDKSYTYIAPSYVCHSAADDLWTVHFLLLRCLHRRQFHSSMLRPLNTIELLDTGYFLLCRGIVSVNVMRKKNKCKKDVVSKILLEICNHNQTNWRKNRKKNYYLFNSEWQSDTTSFDEMRLEGKKKQILVGA